MLARGKQLRTPPAAKAAAPARAPQVSEPETFTAAGLTGQRTKKVTAALVPTKVPERGKTPVAIAFSGTTPPLGYDGGHVIGLHLGGANVSSNVVPMYPRFNRGVWKVLEDRIKAEAHKRSGLVMTVTMTYAGTDPRIPSSFDVAVADGATGASVLTGSLSQPGDIPDVVAMPGDVRTVIGAAESFNQPLGPQADQFLLGGGTFAEAVAATGGRHLPVSKKAMYPDDPKNRPYGPLDVLALNGMLRVPGLGAMGAFTDFTAAQRELLLQVNRERNGGTMTSDDPADPCQVLDPRGAANAPEIDHIIPKVLGGSNFFSNARVVSWQLNNKEDRIKPISELVDVSRLAAPTLPTLIAAKASVIGAQWLAHHPDDAEVAPALLSHWIVMRWPTLGPERLSPRLVKAVLAELAQQGRHREARVGADEGHRQAPTHSRQAQARDQAQGQEARASREDEVARARSRQRSRPGRRAGCSARCAPARSSPATSSSSTSAGESSMRRCAASPPAAVSRSRRSSAGSRGAT